MTLSDNLLLMWRKLESLRAIDDTGIVLIVRLDDGERAEMVAEAAIAGGIRALEITYSVPDALGIIGRLSRRHSRNGVVIGAGTVLDAEGAFAAVQSGAELLVSPNLNPAMLTLANRYQVAAMSGASTPTEIVETLAAGADIVKLFPSSEGPEYVKTVLAPLARAPIAPAGGVTIENIRDWFDAGVACVGVGSAVSKAGDAAAVTAAARAFVDAVAAARR